MENTENRTMVKETIKLFSGLGFTEISNESPYGGKLNFQLINPLMDLDKELSIWVYEGDLEDGNGEKLYYTIFDGMSTLHITQDLKELYDYYISNFN